MYKPVKFWQCGCGCQTKPNQTNQTMPSLVKVKGQHSSKHQCFLLLAFFFFFFFSGTLIAGRRPLGPRGGDGRLALLAALEMVRWRG